MSAPTATRDRRRANAKKAPQTWTTPRPMVRDLAVRHALGRFHLDAAADRTNAVCARWLGPGSPIAEDALKISWQLPRIVRVRVFLNPPWGNVAPFVEHALEEVPELGVVVMVLPCRADSRWWRWLERPPLGVTTMRDDVDGRIAYGDPLGKRRASPAEGTTVWIARPTLRAADYRLPRLRLIRGTR